MRYVVFGFCIFAAACAGELPTAPTPSAMTASAGQIGGEIVTAEATGGSALPFKGTFEGLETVGTVPSQHHIDATGNASHLGRFTVTADFTVSGSTASGTTTWTAANGDEFSTSFTSHGVVVPPTLTATEAHTITGGTGRFANASGTFTVVRTRGLSMPYNISSTIIDGTIDLGH
jgi:hypothetical protein